jgi:hypothetical protein
LTNTLIDLLVLLRQSAPSYMPLPRYWLNLGHAVPIIM